MSGHRTVGLIAAPVTFRQACAFVAARHRHHQPPRGHKFSVGAVVGDRLVGVAMASRPVSRALDDGWTAEVVRLCTDGTGNACSFLYGAAARAAAGLGFRRLFTYTLPEEGGASLRAAGFILDGGVRGRSWSCPSRPRDDRHPLDDKLRWLRRLGPEETLPDLRSLSL